MGIRNWNIYKRGGAEARVGDRVRFDGRVFEVVGTQGSDSQGEPYVRMRPVDPGPDDAPQVICLVSKVERVR